MTYEELLSDNQRLRKRIIELEQENARHKRLDEPLLSEPKSPTLESRKSLTKEEEKEFELRRMVNLFRFSLILVEFCKNLGKVYIYRC